ncbi:MAG TPA: hypothetical protein VK716_14540 [Terracidiphilus sp.]|nr:hypothetical protein [Terracidiphilus sp.]
MTGMRRAWFPCVLLILGIAGCKVHVDKDANGQEKTVQVETPFGGVHVNSDQTSAADLGMPVYPGAEMVRGDDKHKSADIHMGFGEWQLRIRAVSYATPDSQDKVAAFYAKALEKYGIVLTCEGRKPVSTATVTGEGLTCADGKGDSSTIQIDDKDVGTNGKLELKAGSKRHQHIVGFDEPENGKTRFALVIMDLPATKGDGDKSD